MTGQHRAVTDRHSMIDVYRHLVTGLTQAPGRRSRSQRDVLIVAAMVTVAVIVTIVVAALTIAWAAVPAPAQDPPPKARQTIYVIAHCHPGFPPSGPYRICTGG